MLSQLHQRYEKCTNPFGNYNPTSERKSENLVLAYFPAGKRRSSELGPLEILGVGLTNEMRVSDFQGVKKPLLDVPPGRGMVHADNLGGAFKPDVSGDGRLSCHGVHAPL